MRIAQESQTHKLGSTLYFNIDLDLLLVTTQHRPHLNKTRMDARRPEGLTEIDGQHGLVSNTSPQTSLPKQF